MQIAISELRLISNQLFDHLEKNGHMLIELDADYYWVISKEDLYDPYKEPKRIYLGQLSDDFDLLKKILSRNELEPTAYALIWLSSILRYIGEKVVF